ncbi:MAG: hypothetical protein SFY32_14225 [Bacteroidota bacterium]|nr:hypothetical protein [Bacteroidota bacterium]
MPNHKKNDGSLVLIHFWTTFASNMKTSIAIILIFIISISSVFKGILFFEYAFNQKYIAENLCVNKQKKNGCNGSCYLSKKIKKAEQSNNIPTWVKTQNEIIFFQIEPNTLIFNNIASREKPNHFFDITGKLPTTIHNIFQPPQSATFLLHFI